HGDDVRDVDVGVGVTIEVGDADAHRVARLVGADLRGDVFELPVAEIAVPGVDAEVVAADERLAAVAVEVEVPDRLRPSDVLHAAAGADVFEDEVALVAEQLVGKGVAVAARERRQDAVNVVAEVADVEVELAVAVEVEGRGRTADESL